METEFKECELLLDDHRGIYIPRDFAINFETKQWGVDAEDVAILFAGPDHELYWETWDNVMRNAEYTDEKGRVWHLFQDGPLFAVIYSEED